MRYCATPSGLQPSKETPQNPTANNSPSRELQAINSSRHLPNFTFLTTHQRLPSSSTRLTQGKTRDSWKVTREREEMVAVVGAIAVLSWVVSGMGYFVVTMKKEDGNEGLLKDWIKVSIGLLSLCQCALIVLKHRYLKAYKKAVKRTASIGRFSLSLHQSFPSRRKALCNLLLEASFHLIIFIPKFNLRTYVSSFGIYSEFALDDCFYLFILARNYHTVELLYWMSYLSHARTYLFAQLVGVRVTKRFLFSSYLDAYALRIVTSGLLLIVAAPGVIEYLFARIESIQDYYTIWGEYWVISVTQVPIGYGDDSAKTLFGNASLLVSCFTGILLLGLLTSITMHTVDLNLVESSMYSELLYSKYKRKYEEPAAKLMQRWWRLMTMRRRKQLNGAIITCYYSCLLEYRGVLTKCQRVKDPRFEAQIEAFHRSARHKFRSMNEYLHPVNDAYGFMQDIIRNQYRLYILTSNLVSRTHRYSSTSGNKGLAAQKKQQKARRKQLQKGNTNNYTGQGFARAKIAALHNVRGRLVQGTATLYPLCKL